MPKATPTQLPSVPSPSRRDFLSASAAAMGAASIGYWPGVGRAAEDEFRSPNEKPVAGYIGAGIRFYSLIDVGLPYCRAAAVCDVDARHLRNAEQHYGKLTSDRGESQNKLDLYEDYHRVLDRSDIDVVVIATPDHWHTKIAIEAMQAGKDVYCEKPLTLTIAEGQQILKVLKETGRVFQVGTQQRSVERFQTAVALMRDGRIGEAQRVTCGIGSTPTSGPLPVADVPKELNWDLWQGPTPAVDYRQASSLPDSNEYGSQFPYSRAHAHFRWWYEYAGGKLTDWGAHHVDIAMWALGKSTADIGNYTIEPLAVEHPVPFEDGMPTENDRFNTATKFHVRVTFADGVELDIRDDAADLGFDNGIMFQGETGRYFVNRQRLTGKPVEDLADDPLPDGALDQLYAHRVDVEDGEGTTKQMVNFLECVKSRETPLSDVASHHRNLTVCHAGNLALRLGRKLTYDPAQEKFVDDERANEMIAREQRKGYEIKV